MIVEQSACSLQSCVVHAHAWTACKLPRRQRWSQGAVTRRCRVTVTRMFIQCIMFGLQHRTKRVILYCLLYNMSLVLDQQSQTLLRPIICKELFVLLGTEDKKRLVTIRNTNTRLYCFTVWVYTYSLNILIFLLIWTNLISNKWYTTYNKILLI